MCRLFDCESITLILISPYLFDVCQNYQSSHNKITGQLHAHTPLTTVCGLRLAHTSKILVLLKNKGSIFLSYLLVIVGGRILAGGKMAALKLVQFGVLLFFTIIIGMYFILKQNLQALTADFEGSGVR